MTVGARPDRDLVSPPELARHAPVRRLLERLDRESVLALGVVADAPHLQRLDRRPCELVHAAPPLQRDERLDAGVAALTRADRVAVVLPLLELPLAGQPVEDDAVRLGLGQPLESLRTDHPAVGADDGERLEAVIAADLEVGRVVARGDLERARPEVGVDPLVCDDRDMPADHGHDDLLADRVDVPWVVGIHGNRDVGENRRRPDRGDRDRARASEMPSTNG